MSRATFARAELGRSWIAEFEIDGWRAVVSPGTDGRRPFIVSVHDPENSEKMRALGVISAGQAIEKALTFLAGSGVRVDNRLELFEIAGHLDASAEAPITLGVPREVAAFAAGMYGAGQHDWRIIAGAIAGCGHGHYQTEALKLAAYDWVRVPGRTDEQIVESVCASVERTKGRPS
jgi:hypothetical protein